MLHLLTRRILPKGNNRHPSICLTGISSFLASLAAAVTDEELASRLRRLQFVSDYLNQSAEWERGMTCHFKGPVPFQRAAKLGNIEKESQDAGALRSVRIKLPPRSQPTPGAATAKGETAGRRAREAGIAFDVL